MKGTDKTLTDEEIQDLTRRVLDRREQELDGATRSRLTRIRHQALDEMGETSNARWWPGLLAGAAALVLALGVGMRSAVPPAAAPPGLAPSATASGSALQDLALLSSAEFELLEDLEFYLWLEDALESG